MRSLFRYFAPLLLAVALVSPVVMIGCATHVRYGIKTAITANTSRI